MKLTHLTNKELIIARKVAVSGDKMALTTVTATFANIQPATDSSTEIAEGIFGKSFRLYFDAHVDLRMGDRLRDVETGDYYSVVSDGVTRRTMGSIDYVIALVQKTKN